MAQRMTKRRIEKMDRDIENHYKQRERVTDFLATLSKTQRRRLRPGAMVNLKHGFVFYGQPQR